MRTYFHDFVKSIGITPHATEIKRKRAMALEKQGQHHNPIPIGTWYPCLAYLRLTRRDCQPRVIYIYTHHYPYNTHNLAPSVHTLLIHIVLFTHLTIAIIHASIMYINWRYHTMLQQLAGTVQWSLFLGSFYIMMRVTIRQEHPVMGQVFTLIAYAVLITQCTNWRFF